MRHWLWAFLLVGCSTPTEPGRVLQVSVHPTLGTLALAHRWQTQDIHHYELILKGERGELSRLSLVPNQTGSFAHLRQGVRYQVEARVWGNRGGSAPDTCLNQEMPCVATVDLGGKQDLEDRLTVRLSPTLDPVPFSGTATVLTQNLPSWARTLDLLLLDDTGTRFSSSFPVGPLTLSSLRAGVHYRIRLSAVNKTRVRTVEQPLFFDPEAVELEQAATVSFLF